MVRALKIIGVFLLAMLATWFCVAAAGLAYMEFFKVFDRDGGGAMSLIFQVGPFFGLIGGVVTAVWFARRPRKA